MLSKRKFDRPPFSKVIFYVEGADGTLLLVFNICLQINTLMIKINISVPALKTGIKNMIISFWIIIISRWSSQTSQFLLGLVAPESLFTAM